MCICRIAVCSVFILGIEAYAFIYFLIDFHSSVEPMGGESQGDGWLWWWRLQRNDLSGAWKSLEPGDFGGWAAVWMQSDSEVPLVENTVTIETYMVMVIENNITFVEKVQCLNYSLLEVVSAEVSVACLPLL